MPEKYFEKFNTIVYANTKAKDLTERVVITQKTLNNPYTFYPYVLLYEKDFLDEYPSAHQFSSAVPATKTLPA